MLQGATGQIVVHAVTIPSPTTKHATMVRAVLVNFAEFVEELCRKERTCWIVVVILPKQNGILYLDSLKSLEQIFLFCEKSLTSKSGSII
jgi:hypothetical protein